MTCTGIVKKNIPINSKNSILSNKFAHCSVIIYMKRTLITIILASVCLCLSAQKDKIMNKPFIDNRRLHWGFFFGMNFMDMEIKNNGHIDPATGEQWFADVNRIEPGFSVGVLGALRLNKYMELRLSPTMHFGQKFIQMHENISGRDTSQNMRTNYISVPVSVKFAAPRHNNFRPYFTLGLSPTFSLSNHNQEAFKAKTFDCYLEVGMGCDIYLPYFKLIPELKFCFGLIDIISKKRDDLLDKSMIKFTNSVESSSANMIVLSLYFE